VQALLEAPLSFCGVAQVAVHRSHKPVGGGASPPATSIPIVVSTGVRPSLISSGELPDERRRLGSTPRTTTTRGPRDFGDRVTNADRSGSTPLTGANSYPRRRNFGAGPPKAGCECSTHSVGAIWPLKHMQMCACLVSRRQLVQIQPSAPDMPFKL
jgi:hypothetical protein